MSDTSNDFNQRSMRAIILCVMVAIIYTQFFLAPQKRATQPQTFPSASPVVVTSNGAAVAGQVGQPSVPAVSSATSPTLERGRPTSADISQAPQSLVRFNKATIAITHLGARITHFKLSDYKREQSSDDQLDLVDGLVDGVRPLGLYLGSESDERAVYSLVSINGAPPAPTGAAEIVINSGQRAVLDFRGALPSGIGVTKRFTFSDDSYLINLEVVLDKPAPNGQSVWLEWPHYYSSAVEKDLRIKHNITYLDNQNKIQHLPIEDLPQGSQEYGVNRWIALGDTYFAQALIPTVSTRNTLIGREGDVFYTRVAGTTSGGQFYAYVGPKDYRILETVGNFSLERSIDLGWFSFLALPLLWLLRFLYSLVGNYGVAIIGLTLLVKAVMLPLSKASFQSAKKMQELQPEIKALRERIKDPNQLNQEMFALYKRKGVNPMGGCFPMLIQIPVFLGLYNALLNAIELRHAPYAVWIKDLSAPESLQLFGIGVPVMVLLMAVTMIYQTWTTPNPSADPAQQKMMMIMPVVFAGMFIVFPMPAGLVLYWLTNNIISIIQQVYMRSAAKGSVYISTVVASAIIFGVGYLITLI